jgi:hypothetical protein
VVVARQIEETPGGKRVASAVAGASPHKFAWCAGDPASIHPELAEAFMEREAESIAQLIPSSLNGTYQSPTVAPG